MQSLEFLSQATSSHLYNIRAAAVFFFSEMCILTLDNLSTYWIASYLGGWIKTF